MSKEEHCAFIKGDRIDLTPRNKDHIEVYTKWQNDSDVRTLMRNEVPKTVEEMEKRFESRGTANDRVGIEIYHKKDKKPIGSAGIFRIDWTARTALMGLKIGEPTYWNEGYATEATNLLLKYAFEELGLNKLKAYIFSPNTGSYSVAEKAGFKRVGTIRNEGYVDGKYVDGYVYRIFRDEWEELQQ